MLLYRINVSSFWWQWVPGLAVYPLYRLIKVTRGNCLQSYLSFSVLPLEFSWFLAAYWDFWVWWNLKPLLCKRPPPLLTGWANPKVLPSLQLCQRWLLNDSLIQFVNMHSLIFPKVTSQIPFLEGTLVFTDGSSTSKAVYVVQDSTCSPHIPLPSWCYKKNVINDPI